MFIVNPATLSKTIKVSKRLGEYILEHYKIPVLSKIDEEYVFSDTPELKQILEKLPLLVKIFYR